MTRGTAEELQRTAVHVLVRDYPETLAVLRAGGIDVHTQGAALLSELSASAPSLAHDIESAIAWRRVERSQPDA